MNILMIGRSLFLLKRMKHPGLNFFIVENPATFVKDGEEFYKQDFIGGYRIAEYYGTDRFLDGLTGWHREHVFDGVLTGIEYGVGAADKAAWLLGLPRIGAKAACCLTDKYRLRLFCTENGIPAPEYRKIETPADLHAFYTGCPVIFKPSNRQASCGVVKILSPAEIDTAYRFTTACRDKMCSGEQAAAFLAETYVEGPEYSVETLVYEGECVFANITAKRTTAAPFFVETGHLVPAPLAEGDARGLRECQEKLSRALGVEHAILHGEWKLTQHGPVLIECAGRMPGDRITDLIGLSYDFDLYQAYLNVLTGRAPVVNRNPCCYSLIHFFTPPPGILKEITGEEVLRGPLVRKWKISVRPGAEIPETTDSWARSGYVILQGEDYRALEDYRRRICERLRFVV